MNKKEKLKLLQELLVYYPNGKKIVNLGLFLSGISAVGLMFPIIFLWLAVKEIFLMYPTITLTYELKTYVYLSVIIAILSMFLYCLGLLCTHKVAFAVAKNIRFISLSHLMELPLGYFQKSGSGNLRRLISDSASRTESYIAHQLPDMVGAVITPIIVLILTFTFDWRMGFISLIPLVLAAIAMIWYNNSYSEYCKKR